MFSFSAVEITHDPTAELTVLYSLFQSGIIVNQSVSRAKKRFFCPQIVRQHDCKIMAKVIANGCIFTLCQLF